MAAILIVFSLAFCAGLVLGLLWAGWSLRRAEDEAWNRGFAEGRRSVYRWEA